MPYRSPYDASHRSPSRNVVRYYQSNAKGFGVSQRFAYGAHETATITSSGEFFAALHGRDLARFVAAVMVNSKGSNADRRAMALAVRNLRTIAA